MHAVPACGLFCGVQVSGEPIPVPKVDPADKEKFDKTVDEIHAKVRPSLPVDHRMRGRNRWHVVFVHLCAVNFAGCMV